MTDTKGTFHASSILNRTIRVGSKLKVQALQPEVKVAVQTPFSFITDKMPCKLFMFRIKWKPSKGRSQTQFLLLNAGCE